jgi:DNA repair protein RadC
MPIRLIRDLPPSDRPRERLRDAGAAALSNAELLAILLRTGTSKESALAQATRLLAAFEGLPGLRNAPFLELCAAYGIGEAKASQIKAALEMGLRLAAFSPDSRPFVRTPDDIANLVLAEMSVLAEEQVRVMLLDARNRVLEIPTVYIGRVHTTNVRIAELLSERSGEGGARSSRCTIIPRAIDAVRRRHADDEVVASGDAGHRPLDHVVRRRRYVSMSALSWDSRRRGGAMPPSLGNRRVLDWRHNVGQTQAVRRRCA